jgi:uncharacterized protein (DUF849 family)
VNREVVITCALTGAGDTVGKSEHVPVTPAQIAASAVEAANAGAAVVHIHVRDVETGQGSRDVALYREVVRRVRDSGCRTPLFQLCMGIPYGAHAYTRELLANTPKL